MERSKQISALLAWGLLLWGCSDDGGPAQGGSPDAGSSEPDAPSEGPCEFDVDCAALGVLCIEGECRPASCHPDALSCLDNNVARCKDDARTYTIEASCTGQVCVRGECIPKVCEPGSVVCGDRARLVCNDSGEGYATRPCFGDQVCFNGSCVDASCSPGKTICLDDLTLGMCDAGGGGYVGRLCGFGLRCAAAGGCIPHRSVALGDAGRLTADPIPRPALGWMALWLVRDRDAAGVVELIGWEDAGLYAWLDADAGALLVAPSVDTPEEDLARYPLWPQTGDVIHLAFNWTQAGALEVLVDGFRLGPPLDGALSAGGSSGGVLQIGRFSPEGAAWPGRVGSVHIGAGVLDEGFTPRCDLPPATAQIAEWPLNEGEGEVSGAETPQTPDLRLEDGAAWDGGLLGRYGSDSDGDTYGFDQNAMIACTPPFEGDRLRLGDCNDANATVYSGAPEPPDQVDNDCDGSTDETP